MATFLFYVKQKKIVASCKGKFVAQPVFAPASGKKFENMFNLQRKCQIWSELVPDAAFIRFNIGGQDGMVSIESVQVLH